LRFGTSDPMHAHLLAKCLPARDKKSVLLNVPCTRLEDFRVLLIFYLYYLMVNYGIIEVQYVTTLAYDKIHYNKLLNHTESTFLWSCNAITARWIIQIQQDGLSRSMWGLGTWMDTYFSCFPSFFCLIYGLE